MLPDVLRDCQHDKRTLLVAQLFQQMANPDLLLGVGPPLERKPELIIREQRHPLHSGGASGGTVQRPASHSL